MPNRNEAILDKPRGETKMARRRADLRDSLWPNSEQLVWSRKRNDGFITVPRLLPLVTHLIKILAPKGDPSSTYIELWCRVFDEGIVSIFDESSHAYAAGYTGTRCTHLA